MARKTKRATSTLEPQARDDTDQDTPQNEHTGPTGHDPRITNLDGRAKHRRTLERFETLKDDDKQKELRDTWKSVAMGAVIRAKSMITTCAPKDFGRLYQVIMSGAVAIDKAFPKVEQTHNNSLVINMFGSLGQRAAAIAMPPTPEVKVINPPKQEAAWPSLDVTTTSLSTTSMETSPTTTPSTPLLIAV